MSEQEKELVLAMATRIARLEDILKTFMLMRRQLALNETATIEDGLGVNRTIPRHKDRRDRREEFLVNQG